MIDAAIGHISSELNQYLKRVSNLDEDLVALSSVVEQDGAFSTHVNNKLAVFLVHLEKDTVPYRQQGVHSAASSVVNTTAPVYLNVYLMFAGCFGGSNYSEGLKHISNTITFFQRRPVFDRQNSPGMDERINKLILDIQNMSLHDMSSLWGVLGGRYLPSVMYKVRMAVFDVEDVIGQTSVLSAPEPSLEH